MWCFNDPDSDTESSHKYSYCVTHPSPKPCSHKCSGGPRGAQGPPGPRGPSGTPACPCSTTVEYDGPEEVLDPGMGTDFQNLPVVVQRSSNGASVTDGTNEVLVAQKSGLLTVSGYLRLRLRTASSEASPPPSFEVDARYAFLVNGVQVGNRIEDRLCMDLTTKQKCIFMSHVPSVKQVCVNEGDELTWQYSLSNSSDSTTQVAMSSFGEVVYSICPGSCA